MRWVIHESRMPSYVAAIASTNASSPTSGKARKVSECSSRASSVPEPEYRQPHAPPKGPEGQRVFFPRFARSRARVPPAQPVPQELVSGLLQESDPRVFVLLVLRCRGRTIHGVSELFGPKAAR